VKNLVHTYKKVLTKIDYSCVIARLQVLNLAKITHQSNLSHVSKLARLLRTLIIFKPTQPMSNNDGRAFTLAEVLITLGIIGVIAALTIPTLVKNSEEIATVSRVKKAYSIFSQAYISAETNEGPIDTWNWIASDDGTGATNALNILAKYLKISKNCGTATGCLPDVSIKNLDNLNSINQNNDTKYAKAILDDGTLLIIISRSPNCKNSRGTTLALQNICGFISVDTNGFQGPNQVGKDYFDFYITRYGIIPIGTVDEISYPPSNCNKADTGKACTAWVLQKGNMDYLD